MVCSNPYCKHQARNGYKTCKACSEYKTQWRKNRAARGFCLYGCAASAVPGSDYCQKCIDYKNRTIPEGICSRWCNNKKEEGLSKCRKCLNAANTTNKLAQIKAKKEVFDHYGHTCVCCGETEPTFLQLDHIYNDGYLERKNHNRNVGGLAMYKNIINKGFPDTLQVLCANCNFGKHLNGGVCPHQNGV